MKFKDLVEGKEYKSGEDSVIYAVEDGLLFSVTVERYSIKSAREISNMEFTELPWEPEIHERYYYVDITCREGYASGINYYNGCFERINSRAKVYKTKKEVIAAVKELGWSIE